MNKNILVLALIGGILGGIVTSHYTPVLISQNTHIERVGNPTRIIIPKLNIEANIEQVGMTDTGRMDIPKNIDDVAWYDLGAKPGEVGSAVIGGHLDSKTGPAIFYKLYTLKPNDYITIIDENNKTYNFKVSEVKVFSDNNFPINTVFTRNDQSRLNLITCYGTYSKTLSNYNQRVVVFSVLQP